jgi:hypothetical protein
MNSLKDSCLIFVFLLTCSGLFAQKSIKDSTISFSHITILYSANAPGGDMADRFGFTNLIGGEVGYKLKSNWMFNTGLRFLFGSDVRELVARNVSVQIGTDATGYTTQALGADGRFYQLRFNERGFVIPLTVSKIIPLSKKRPNSGIFIEAGGQYIQHKILMDVVGNGVPNLEKRYRKGYDRLSSGFGAVEGIGYRFFSKRRTINFFMGLEFSQNFTRSRRTFQYDLGRPETGTRMDFLYGVKAGWTFPIYQAAPDDAYFY